MFVVVLSLCSWYFYGSYDWDTQLVFSYGSYDLNSTSEEREAVKTQKRLEKFRSNLIYIVNFLM